MSRPKNLVLEGPITKIEFEGTHFTARIDTVNGQPSEAYAFARNHWTGELQPKVYGGMLVGARGKLIPAAVGDRARFVLTPAEGEHQRFVSISVNGQRTNL